MKKIYVFSLLLFVTEVLSAQTVSDMVRFSSTSSSGSARVAAMGGAFGALGGDLSAVGINPAGTGVFEKPELSITPSYNFARVKADGRHAKKNSFQLGTLGGVMVFHLNDSRWKKINLAINYSSSANFNRISHQSVSNSPTSFNQIWSLEANRDLQSALNSPTPPEELDFSQLLNARSQMAYNTGLISYNEFQGAFEPTLLAGEEVEQRKYIRETGFQGECNFSIGTDYDDKLYLGFSVGICTIDYKYKSVFTGYGIEQNGNINYFGLDCYNFGQDLKTKALGTNFKFGVMYHPIPELNIGASVQTPTFYSSSDKYTENMHSSFFEADENGCYGYDSYIIPVKYDYDMRTPWKAMFSVATTLFQQLVISADYEYMNYSSAKFCNGADGYDFSESDGSGANDLIKTTLKNVHNFRIGTEYSFNKMLCLRGGYSYMGSPYKQSLFPTYLVCDMETQAASLGCGLDFGRFYVDVALIYKFSKDIDTSYFYQNPSDSDYDVIAKPIHNKYTDYTGKVSVGFKL